MLYHQLPIGARKPAPFKMENGEQEQRPYHKPDTHGPTPPWPQNLIYPRTVEILFRGVGLSGSGIPVWHLDYLFGIADCFVWVVGDGNVHDKRYGKRKRDPASDAKMRVRML